MNRPRLHSSIRFVQAIFVLALTLGFTAVRPAAATNCSDAFCEVTDVVINGHHTYAKVSPGEILNVTAHYRVWNAASCLACWNLVVVGIDNVPWACLYQGYPMTYPGDQGELFFQMQAPNEPGRHEVRWKRFYGLICGQGAEQYPAGQDGVVAYIEVGDDNFAAVMDADIARQGKNATVPPGATFTVTANYGVWSGNSCTACPAQIVLGIGSVGQTCLYDGHPQSYPGVAGRGTVTMTAPSAPGTYEIRWRHEVQTSCFFAELNFGAGQDGTLGTITVVDSPGSCITNVNVNGQGTDATVQAGSQFTLSADFQIWNPTWCPSCLDQLALGLDDQGQTCLYDGLPLTYPGDQGSNTVSLTAPETPGVYSINWKHELQFNCSGAVSNFGGNQNGTLACLTVTERPSDAGESAALPASYRLRQAAPSPFRDFTDIGFEIPRTSPVDLAIYDAGGRCVKVLEHGVLSPGSFSRRWNGDDAAGHRVSAGVYWARLRGGAEARTSKLVVIQ